MAGLTNPPGFGDTEWPEDQWAKSLGMNGPRFTVAGPTDWRPTASSTRDRTVNIFPGAGSVAGGAVYDETAESEAVPCAPNTTQSDRYDVIVAQWDWGTKKRRFMAITGTVAPPLINASRTLNINQVNRIPGVMFDGVIALVRVRPSVGTFATTDVTDCRVWVAGGMPNTASDYLAYSDIGENGLVVTSNGLAQFVNGGTRLLDRSQGRRWNWGGIPYEWRTNIGSWNMAPGSQGKFYAVAGHTYMIQSRVSFGSVAGNESYNWRMSIQAGANEVNNSNYGTIVEEIEGTTGVGFENIYEAGHYYAGASGNVHFATMFATSGPCSVRTLFTSPQTTVIDLGWTPPPLIGTGR